MIVSDTTTTAALRKSGFSSATAFGDATPQQLANADYMIDVPTETGATALALRAQSLPVATFGTGAGVVSAREVLGSEVGAARSRLAADAELRTGAGRELLANHGLVPDAALRALLQDGRVDIRAETVLSDLASLGRVEASDPTVDPAERRAGRPVRSLSVTSTDVRATQALLTSVAVPYRPDTVAMVSPHKLRLTWMPAVSPAPSAGG